MLARTFEELNKDDTAIAGGKGASLGEMTQAGIPVPLGFVVLASAFERFLEETDLNVEIDAILHTVNHKEMHTVENASEKIQALILAAQMPKDIAAEIMEEFSALGGSASGGKNLGAKYVAVRSSATAEDSASAAWAGQLDSFLNTTEKDLLKNVQRCWASLFTPRAIFYRFELEGRLSPTLRGGVPEGRGGAGLHSSGDISVAVVVQKMVESEVSGIAFSVHPVTEDRNQLIIEAGFGLGEAIVSGQITPDSYVVEKQPRRIIDKNISEQEKQLVRTPSYSPLTKGALPSSAGGMLTTPASGDLGTPFIKGDKSSVLADSPLPLRKGELRMQNEWKAIPKERGGQQKLSDKQILELSELVLKIEKHYGFPCDIEWALENRKFYIVQSRPITTLGDKHSPELSHILMSKVYSREKTLFYFSMWNDSDRRGWRNLLNHDVRHNIFLIPPPGKKGSVWYSQRELDEIDGLLRKKLKTTPEIISQFIKTLNENWEILFPYLSDRKKIESIDEFRNYYDHLVDWWSAMNTAFTIPDMGDVDEDTKKRFLAYRVESEKYTEKMNKVMVVFWKEHFPEFSEYTFCIAPSEVEKIASNPSLISELENRKNGFFMLDEKMYPMQELDSLLAKNNLSLEEVSTEGVEEIKGAPAYHGRIQGQVRKILSFGDMDTFRDGEILVTEMTNPDYVPIMKIASAIITDEGGITCHAAIVARELKKPCIIGTKIATKVLKDGDVVEVDAERGMVTILQKASELQKTKETLNVRKK